MQKPVYDMIPVLQAAIIINGGIYLGNKFKMKIQCAKIAVKYLGWGEKCFIV